MKNISKTLLVLSLALGLASFSKLTDTPILNVYLGEQLINKENVALEKIRTATFVSVRDKDGQVLKIKSFKFSILIRKSGLSEWDHSIPVLGAGEQKLLSEATPGDFVQLTQIVVEDLTNAEIKLADVYCTLQ